MGLLDRRPKGRPGVVLLIALGVVAVLIGTTVAILAWGDEEPEGEARPPAGTADALVRVISRAGGFAVDAPGALVGDSAGRGLKLRTGTGDLVITAAPSGTDGLDAGHASALDAIRGTYPEVRVDGEIRTTLGGLPARRSVGVIQRVRGDELIFSVTTGASARRTWSVVMFAASDIKPARLERFYQPVLDGFRVLK